VVDGCTNDYLTNNAMIQPGGFSSYSSYSLSKLCIAALSHELATRVSSEDVLVMSCDPGKTNTRSECIYIGASDAIVCVSHDRYCQYEDATRWLGHVWN
jgi:NAD(P)-dependent dehydrogenase (short-subunit alcohol dehydrogenase family)